MEVALMVLLVKPGLKYFNFININYPTNW